MYTTDVTASDRFIKDSSTTTVQLHSIALIGRDDVILAIPTEPINPVWLVHAIHWPVLDVDAFGVNLDKNRFLKILQVSV